MISTLSNTRMAAVALVAVFSISMPIRSQVLLWANNEVDPTSNNKQFKFKAVAGGAITIDLEYVTYYINTFLSITRDSDNASVSNEDIASDNTNSRIANYLVQSGQNYTVTATTSQPGFASGRFRLFISIANSTTPVIRSTSASVSAPIINASSSPALRNTSAFLRVNTGLIEQIRWVKNGAEISGANASALSIPSLQDSDAGTYSCRGYFHNSSSPSVYSYFPGISATLAVSSSSYSQSANTWKQSHFVIGSSHDPALNGNTVHDEDQYQKLVSANFNLATGYHDVPLTAPGWESYNTPGTPSNIYRLNRVISLNLRPANVGNPLQLFVIDKRFGLQDVRFVSTDLSSAISDFSQSTIPALRSAMFGYHVGDEPWYQYSDVAQGQFGTSISENLRKLEMLATDVEKPGFINLRSSWGFNSLAEYEEYVRLFALNKETKIISFDYYPLDKGTSTNSAVPGYSVVPNSPGNRTSYFRHHRIFAESVKFARTSLGKVLQFWGFGCSSEHQLAYGTDNNFRHYIDPDITQLRYQAFTPIIYGARGLLWYTFELHPSGNGQTYIISPSGGPTGETTRSRALLADLTTVNGEAKNLGPLVMKLDWVTTIHGTSVDPNSGEQGLPTKDSGQTIIATATTMLASQAVGIFQHSQTKENYLLILNKNITNPATGALAGQSTSTYIINGRYYIYRFDKAIGAWKVHASSRAGETTSFAVTPHSPGDLEIYRLTKGPWIPAVNGVLLD